MADYAESYALLVNSFPYGMLRALSTQNAPKKTVDSVSSVNQSSSFKIKTNFQHYNSVLIMFLDLESDHVACK